MTIAGAADGSFDEEENMNDAFYADSSSDPSGAGVVSYEWDAPGATFGANNSSFIALNWDLPGDHTLTLRVTNAAGETASSSVVVHVSDDLPYCNSSAFATPDNTVQLTGYEASPEYAKMGRDGYVFDWDMDYDGKNFQAQYRGLNVTVPNVSPGLHHIATRISNDDGRSIIQERDIWVGAYACAHARA